MLNLSAKDRLLILSECFLTGTVVAILILVSLIQGSFLWAGLTCVSAVLVHKPIVKRLTLLLNEI